MGGAEGFRTTGWLEANSVFQLKKVLQPPEKLGRARCPDSRPENINREQIPIHFLESKHNIWLFLHCCPAALSVGV